MLALECKTSMAFCMGEVRYAYALVCRAGIDRIPIITPMDFEDSIGMSSHNSGIVALAIDLLLRKFAREQRTCKASHD
eukprot:1498120-Amphidinium_carterae.1